MTAEKAYEVIGIGTAMADGTTDIVIPGTYQGKPVTSIETNAFQPQSQYPIALQI